MQICGDLAEIWREVKARSDKAYVYSLLHNDVPFYVGVGTKRRIRKHESPSELMKPNAKAVRFREIVSSGGVVEYILGWFNDWAGAAAEERRLIALYGRADLGLGTLTNRTNGGQGTSGIAWHSSPKRAEGSRRAAEKNRGRKHTDEHKAKIGAAHKGRVFSLETLAKKSAALKGRRLSPELCAKMSEARRGWKPSAEILAAGAKWRSENAKGISESRKEMWADPDYRQKMSKALKGSKHDPKYFEGKRLRQKEKFSDPEFKKKWAKRHSESLARPESA